MSKKAKPATSSRRAFLKDVVIMGGTAAATLAVGQTQASHVGPEGTAKQEVVKPASKGYHVTPHIADYYEKARF